MVDGLIVKWQILLPAGLSLTDSGKHRISAPQHIFLFECDKLSGCRTTRESLMIFFA